MLLADVSLPTNACDEALLVNNYDLTFVWNGCYVSHTTISNTIQVKLLIMRLPDTQELSYPIFRQISRRIET